MKILITGSSGMIGSELVRQLGLTDVVGIDKEFSKFETPPNFIKYDILEEIPPFKWEFDVIIHLAANARVYDLVLDPKQALENVITTFNVLEFARKQKNSPLVLLASSREVYGNNELGHIFEVSETAGSQRSSESPYAASKISNEAFAWSYMKCYGTNIKIMRFSNVYGKYDFSNRFIPLVIRKMMKNEDVTIFGEHKTLDFTYVSDVVEGIQTLIKTYAQKEISGPVEYNIATGEAARLTEVAEELKTRLKSTSEIKIGENLTGEVINFVADIERIRSLGWKPTISLIEGLDRSIDYYSQQKHATHRNTGTEETRIPSPFWPDSSDPFQGL